MIIFATCFRLGYTVQYNVVNDGPYQYTVLYNCGIIDYDSKDLTNSGLSAASDMQLAEYLSQNQTRFFTLEASQFPALCLSLCH